MTAMTRFSTAGLSHMGRVRQNNEDRYLIDPELGIFIVVDGVGGHAAGEQAAAIAIDTLYTRLGRQVGSVESRIREAITLANNEIFERARTNEEWLGMACVLTVAVVEGSSLIVGHVGDTRLYKIHRGQIRKVTPDHSPVGEREDAGELSEIEAMNHPRRNEVYRDVGTEKHDTHDEGFIEIIKVPFESDSAWVICSDGLSDLVTSAQIRQTVEGYAGDLPAVARSLIDAANQAGGKDNVTVVYVEGEEFARRSDQFVKTGAIAPYEGDTTQLVSDEQGRIFRRPEPGVAPARATALPPPEMQPMPQAAQPARYTQPVHVSERAGAGKLFLSRAALFIYGFIIAIALVVVFERVLGFKLFAGENAKPSQGPRKLTVGVGMQYQRIGEAVDVANAGDTIEVEPGVYQESISIVGKDNISLTSRVPYEALIYPLQEGREGGIAITITGVGSGRITGFKILGDEKRPLSVGIRISGATVEVSDNEIANIDRAGVEITGPGETILRGNYIHDYQGVGVRISGDAKPTLARNVIVHKQQPDKSSKTAIQIDQKEMPVLRWNTIYKADSISVVEGVAKDELLKNNFLVPNEESGERGNQPQAPRQPRRR